MHATLEKRFVAPRRLSGRKGGKFANPDFRAPYEATDTLQSITTARVLYALAEGVCVGPANGLQSFYLDGTPLQNPDGTFNFNGVEIQYRSGTPDQDIMPGFIRQRSEVALGFQVLADVPAEGTLTATGNPADGDFVTIGATVYTFRNSLSSAYDVRIGSSVNVTLNRLVFAINDNGGTEGSDYGNGTAAHASVTAERGEGDTVVLTARTAGTSGNSIATTESSSVLSFDTATLTGGENNSITHRITEDDLDQVNVKVRVPQLTELNIETQELLGSTVTFRIEIQSDNGGFVEHLTDTIEGKTTSPYEREHQIQLAPYGPAPWDVRVVRVTPDSDSSALQNQIFFSSATYVWYKRINYADTALAGVTIDSSQFGTHIPDFTVDMYLAEILVPANYDPETREYATTGPGTSGGAWDGTFKQAWSDNGAWGFYHIIQSRRFGLGRFIDPENVDKFALYEIGRYCDEPVPDGRKRQVVSIVTSGAGPTYTATVTTADDHELATGDKVYINGLAEEFEDEIGGIRQVTVIDDTSFSFEAAQEISVFGAGVKWQKTEPRYTLNVLINTPEAAANVLQAVASNFEAMVYAGAGAVACVQDAPSDVSRVIAAANVKGGHINYTNTSLKTRKNVIHVTWFDKDDQHRPAIETVEDRDAIERRLGIDEVNVIAVGCTNRGQARRKGLRMLYAMNNEKQIAEFSTGLELADIRPGAIIAAADKRIMGARKAGRVVAIDPVSTPDTITIDAPVDISDTGQTHTFNVIMPDGTRAQREIVNAGSETAEIELDSALDAEPLIGAMWWITSASNEARQFRVVSVNEEGNIGFGFTAIEHHPNKYDVIDFEMNLPPPDISDLPTGPLLSPTNLTASEELFQSATGVRARAVFSWQASRDPRAVFYEGEVIIPGSFGFEPVRVVRGLSMDVEIVQEGYYTFRVRAMDSGGSRKSTPWLERQFFFRGLAGEPGNVQNFIVNVTGDTAWFQWTALPDLDLDYYQIRFQPVTDPELASWAASQAIAPNIPRATTTWPLPAMVGTYMIKGFDTSGVESLSATMCVVETPGLTNFNLVATVQEDPDFDGSHFETTVVTRDSVPGLELSAAPGNVLADWDTLASVPFLALGTTGYVDEGLYYFENRLDLGVSTRVRLTSHISGGGFNADDSLAKWATLADVQNLAGVVEGEATIELQLRWTNDDPEGSPTWTEWQSFVIGDYQFRAAEFRIYLRSTRAWITPRLTEIRIIADMQDRIMRGNDVSIAPGGTRINFVPPYISNPPTVAVNVQDLNTGDYYRLTNVDASGFDIEIFDNAATSIGGTIDWVSVGYGVDNS